MAIPLSRRSFLALAGSGLVAACTSQGKKESIALTSSPPPTVTPASTAAFVATIDPLTKKPFPNPNVPFPPFQYARIVQDSTAGRILALDSGGAPIGRAISQRGLPWRWTRTEHLVNEYSPSELADALGFKIAAMVLIQDLGKPQYVETLLSIANEVKISDTLFDSRQFSANIDWRKILDNWEDMEAAFMKGVIPYEQEVFNSGGVGNVQRLLNFASQNQLGVIGSFLYWWSDTLAVLNSSAFTPTEKRQVQEFKIKAKVLKYRGKIKRWIGASEVAVAEVYPWIPPQPVNLYRQLGGRQFIPYVFRWAKEVAPELELTLIDSEVMVSNNSMYRQIRQRFYDLLSYLHQEQTPIDAVAEECNFWIYDPPTKDDVRAFIRRVKDFGYKIAPPEMTIVVSEVYPWRDRPRTVQRVADKDEAQAQVLLNALEVYYDEGAEFGVFSGTDADTWFTHEGYTDTYPEITDESYKPKKAYWAMVDFLKQRVL